MKLPFKLKLSAINWQRYIRPALAVVTLALVLYSAYLIKSSENIRPDQIYLNQQSQTDKGAGLRVNKAALEAVGRHVSPTVPGRDPFAP